MAAYSPFTLLRAFFYSSMLLNLHATLAMPIRRDCTALTPAQSVTARQTTTVGDLLSQDMPCIPTTVDTTALRTTIASLSNTASSPSGTKAMGFLGTWLGKIVKDAWNTLKSTITTIAVNDILDWIGVGQWIQLILEGWSIITSPDHTKVIATSPDGKIKEYVVKQPPKILKEVPCGGNTRKMCP